MTISTESVPSASDNKTKEAEQKIAHYRTVGAITWFLILFVSATFWYGEPVNFVPDGHKVQEMEPRVEPVIATQTYLVSAKPPPTAVVEPEKALVQQVASSKPVVKTSPEPFVQKSDEPPSQKEESVFKQASSSSAVSEKSTWLVRVISYFNQDAAEEMVKNLGHQYEASYKYFEKKKAYSVRVGPYESEEEALADKKRLEQMLHLEAELVKIPSSMQQ